MKKLHPLIWSLVLPMAACATQTHLPTNNTPVPEPSHVATPGPTPKPTSLLDSGTASPTPVPSAGSSADPNPSPTPTSASSSTPTPTPTPTPAPTAGPLVLNSFPQENSNSPFKELVNYRGDKIMYWAKTNPAGLRVPDQIRYAPSGKDVIRLYFDANGDPLRIVNDRSGEFLLLTPKQDSFTLKVYNNRGVYLDGYTVTKNNSSFSGARLLGAPFFSGQLGLYLTTADAKNLSAVLLPVSDNATGAASELASGLQTYINSSPLPATSQLSTLDVESASLGSGFASTSDGDKLTVAGLYAAGTNESLLSSTALTKAKPMLAAGTLMLANWRYVNGNTGSSGNLITDTSARFEAGKSADELYKEQVENINGSRTQMTPAAAPEKKTGQLAGSLSPKADPTRLTFAQNPPKADVPVTGFSVDADGVVVNLSGTVSHTGLIQASGSSGGNALSIETNNGNSYAAGAFTSYLGTGSYSGKIDVLGTCDTQETSGGQGTYVKAHYMNVGEDKSILGSGTSNFTYDAYSIPDQFTVLTFDGKQFGTNGLVSGGDTKSINVPKNWLIVVSVNAPQDGTAWEYTLSCPR